MFTGKSVTSLIAIRKGDNDRLNRWLGHTEQIHQDRDICVSLVTEVFGNPFHNRVGYATLTRSPRIGVNLLAWLPLKTKISFLEVELEPGIARPEETSTHDGEEFALVTKGVMEIIIGDEKYILKEGDSIHYKSNKPHAMRNIGDARCRAIWVTLPPFSL